MYLQNLQDEISKYSEKVEYLNRQTKEFNNDKHFMSAELESKANLIKERYDNLAEPCQVYST